MYFPYQYPDFVEKRIAGKGSLFNLCTDSYVVSIFNIVDFIEKRIAGKGRLFNLCTDSHVFSISISLILLKKELPGKEGCLIFLNLEEQVVSGW